jgi:hypothetical protein
MKRIAEAAYCLFRSTYLQAQWIQTHDLQAAKEEFTNTQKMLALTAQDAAIGYEASNHYLYNENQLLEKLLSLKNILDKA